MPIAYQPAQPLSPSIASAYGASEVAGRNLPALAQMYAQEARLRAEAGQADAAINQRAALADAETRQRQGEVFASLQQRAREAEQANTGRQAEFAASRYASPRDVYLAGAEQQQAAQRASLAAWLNNQEVGQAEMIRYQRQQNAVSEVMASRVPLLAHEKEEILLQLRTGIDATEHRLRNQRAKEFEQQAELERAQTEQRTELMRKQRDLLSMSPEQRTYQQQLSDGTTMTLYVGSDGKEHVQFEKGGGGGDEAKAVKAATDEYSKMRQAAIRIVDGWRKETIKGATGQPPQLRYPNLQNDEAYNAQVFEMTSDLLGHDRQPGNKVGPDEHVQIRTGQRRGGAGGSGGGGGGDWSADQPTARPEPPGGQLENRLPGVTNARNQPFTPGRQDQMNDLQIRSVSNLSEILADLTGRADLPAEKKAAAVGSIHAMHQLIADTGGYAEMSAAQRKEYDRLKAVVLGLPVRPQPAGSGNQAGGGNAPSRSSIGLRPGVAPLGR